MAEYIDKEAAIDAIRGRCWDEAEAISAVRDVPAADAAEVVRGKWKVYHYATGEIDLVCALCCALNAHEDLRGFDLRDWHYCRRCGARLEGFE